MAHPKPSSEFMAQARLNPDTSRFTTWSLTYAICYTRAENTKAARERIPWMTIAGAQADSPNLCLVYEKNYKLLSQTCTHTFYRERQLCK